MFPPCGVPSVWCPLCVVSPPCGLLRVYGVCFFVWLFLNVYVASMYMFLCAYVTPCACSFRMSLHAYVLFMCFSLHAYVPSYDCCWNSYSSNHRLMRQVSGVPKLTSVLTSVRLFGCTQWYRGSRLCPRQLSHLGAVNGVKRLTSVPTRLSCCHCVSVSSFVVSYVSIDTWRDGTQRLTYIEEGVMR